MKALHGSLDNGKGTFRVIVVSADPRMSTLLCVFEDGSMGWAPMANIRIYGSMPDGRWRSEARRAGEPPLAKVAGL